MCLLKSPPMQYAMCGVSDMTAISSCYVEKIVADQNEILSAVVDQLLTTAVTRREYTRSVAYTAVLMANHFQNINATKLKSDFLYRFGQGAVSVFLHYDWKNVYTNSSVDVLAISAFIGDITSFNLISTLQFKTLIGFFKKKIKTRLHIECIHTLLSHAAARFEPQMDPLFFEACLKAVKDRSYRFVKSYNRGVPAQTIAFEAFVLEQLIDRKVEEFPSYCDTSLNLEYALMASVCVGPEIYRKTWQ